MKLYFLLSAVVLALSACVKEQYEGADLAGGKLVKRYVNEIPQWAKDIYSSIL